jgi:AcrR family transcriptional regulator
MEYTPRQFEIIEAAGKILTASGISGLTIKNLAKEMKFTESAVYRHFTSKEEIIIAMLNYLADSIDERFSKATISSDPEENFRALFGAQIRYFNANQHFVVAVFSDGLMEESQRINDCIYNIMQVKMKYLLPIITDGQQKGIFTRVISAEELMHIVMGAFRLQMFKWRMANFSFDINQTADNMVKSILTLIKSK